MTATDPMPTFAKGTVIDVNQLSEWLRRSGLVNGPAAADRLPEGLESTDLDGLVAATQIRRI
jgi:hypothetical protein